jgi:transposase
MAYKSKFSVAEKMHAILRYTNGTESFEAIATDMGVSLKTIQNWMRLYETFGDDGLRGGRTPAVYDDVLKKTVAEAYLYGNKSQDELCKIYRIPSARTIQVWVEEYNRSKLISEIRCRTNDTEHVTSWPLHR